MAEVEKPSRRIPVPAGLHRQSKWFAATAGWWRRLGDLETRVLGDELAEVRIDRPIYVCSLARAGTTIVTELLAACAGVTSHRYSDFPAVWTPFWRNWLLQRQPGPAAEPVERAHRDRIRISNDSPEAVEEVLWSWHFPRVHDPDRVNVLTAADRDPEFDRYYRDHVRKLLLVRGADRYLAKGNYNIARIEYLADLFPDARFVVPVRDPHDHVASLMKQHRLFCEASDIDPRVGLQLTLAGHWEFGPGRRLVNYGDGSAERIARAWASGDEVTGWAELWAATYRYLSNMINNKRNISQAVCHFRYEDLCDASAAVIDVLLDHCGLDPEVNAAVAAEFAGRLSRPDYYRPDFTLEQRATIDRICGPVAARFGYNR